MYPDFLTTDRVRLNNFVSEVIGTAQCYIDILCRKGRIFLPFGLSSYDAAIDTTAEMFTVENHTLVKFRNYFDKIEPKPSSENDFKEYLARFVVKSVQNNIQKIYRDNLPVFYRILRNISEDSRELGLQLTDLAGGRLIHKPEADLDLPYIERDTLASLIFLNGIADISNAKEFIRLVFNILENQKETAVAVFLYDLIFIYKEIILYRFAHRLKGNSNNPESKVHIKLMLEDISRKFSVSLKKYFNKNNFSEYEVKCIYDIIDEVINCLTNGSEYKSVKKLAEDKFGAESGRYENKIEYILKLLMNELAQALTGEEMYA